MPFNSIANSYHVDSVSFFPGGEKKHRHRKSTISSFLNNARNTVKTFNVAQKISARQAANLNSKRVSKPVPKEKKYEGVNKVNQVLRHIATVVHDEAKRLNVRMVEVQCSVYNGKLHLSSNYNSKFIQHCLHRALNNTIAKDRYSYFKKPESPHENKRFHHYATGTISVFSVRKSNGKANKELSRQENILRPERHKKKVSDFISSDRKNLNAKIGRALVDINNGKGIIQDSSLTSDQMKNQTELMLKTLYSSLVEAKRGNFSLIDVHHFEASDFQRGSGGVMHAEQSILTHLASVISEIKQEGQAIIVPIAGRFVPCAVCHEVEHRAKESGIFRKENGVILHRSTYRVGLAYPGIPQLLATTILSEGKGEEIVDSFKSHPSSLSSNSLDVVAGYAFDTQSEYSFPSQSLSTTQEELSEEMPMTQEEPSEKILTNQERLFNSLWNND